MPGIVARIADPGSLPVLYAIRNSQNTMLRKEAIAAFCHIVNREPLDPERRNDIQETIIEELAACRRQQAMLRIAAQKPHTEILAIALEERYNTHLHNAFSLLGVYQGDADMMTILKNLSGDNTNNQAKALEVLDNTLPKEVRSHVLGLFETAGIKTPAGSEDSFRSVLEQTGQEHSHWLRAGALHAAGGNRIAECRDLVLQNLRHASPVVRETALDALGKIGDAAVIREQANIMQDDRHPAVRHVARTLLTSASGGSEL